MTTPTESVSFCILGAPVPKGRPRFVRGRAVTPQRTREYEALVRSVAALHCGHWRRDGLYRVSLHIAATRMRGDIDNVAKGLLDGMQGHAFDNDRQVSELRVVRVEMVQANMHEWRPVRDGVHVVVDRIGDAPAKRKRVNYQLPIEGGGTMHVHGEKKPSKRDMEALQGIGAAAARLVTQADDHECPPGYAFRASDVAEFKLKKGRG